MGAAVERSDLKQAMLRASGERRAELTIKEGLCRLVEDKNPSGAAELFKEVAEGGYGAFSVQGRLLLGHAYRAMGKRRLAVFSYQAVARRETVDDATVFALLALTEIGDATIARVSRNRLDELRGMEAPPEAMALLDGGEALERVAAVYAEE